MAITFEEKSDFGKNTIIFFLMIAVLVAAGFFIWDFLQKTQIVPSVTPQIKTQPNKEALNDPRLDSLELFPEIPPATVETAKTNPFAEVDVQSATTSASVAKVTKKEVSQVQE